MHFNLSILPSHLARKLTRTSSLRKRAENATCGYLLARYAQSRVGQEVMIFESNRLLRQIYGIKCPIIICIATGRARNHLNGLQPRPKHNQLISIKYESQSAPIARRIRDADTTCSVIALNVLTQHNYNVGRSSLGVGSSVLNKTQHKDNDELGEKKSSILLPPTSNHNLNMVRLSKYKQMQPLNTIIRYKPIGPQR